MDIFDIAYGIMWWNLALAGFYTMVFWRYTDWGKPRGKERPPPFM